MMEDLVMSKSKQSPEEIEAESLRLHVLRQQRNKEAIAAVKEMSKHPLSLEQMREQIREHHAEAIKNSKKCLCVDIIETDENGERKEYKEGTHKQILVFGYKIDNFRNKRIVAKSEIFKETGSVSYRNNRWFFNGHKLSKVK